MANLDHQAIRKAYPDASYINDKTGAFKEDICRAPADRKSVV